MMSLKPSHWFVLLSCAALLVLSLLCIAGCGKRNQYAADAIAGVDALRAMIGASVAADLIVEGCKDHIRATVGDAELPPPRMSPEEIGSRPNTYADQGKESREESRSWWMPLLAGIWTYGRELIGIALLATIGTKIPLLRSLITRIFMDKGTKQEHATTSKALDNSISLAERLKGIAMDGDQDATAVALEHARAVQARDGTRDTINARRSG